MTTQLTHQITVDLKNKHATVSYTGDIHQGGFMALKQAVEGLVQDFKYAEIHLELDSNGGAMDALNKILLLLGAHEKNHGVTFVLRGENHCASAAAMLLSLGKWGHRGVKAYTQLVYHDARVMLGASGALTADAAGQLGQVLRQADRGMQDRVITHLVAGAKGEPGLALELQRRCADLRSRWLTLIGKYQAQCGTGADLKCTVKPPEWLSRIEKAAHADKPVPAYRRLMTQLFAKDAVISGLQAYAMCLVDSVECVVDASQLPSPSSSALPTAETIAEALIDEDSDPHARSEALVEAGDAYTY